MTTDDRTLANLTLEIVSTHHSLQGLPPAIAELQYIIEAQKLEGYGVEYYSAKVATTKVSVSFTTGAHTFLTKFKPCISVTCIG